MDFFDIQGYCGEASELMKNKLGDFLKDYGITVKTTNVQLSLCRNVVLKAIDERATMGAMGGMQAYAFKKQVDAQTEAMVSMAKNPNGGMNSMARHGYADGRRYGDRRPDGKYDEFHGAGSCGKYAEWSSG